MMMGISAKPKSAVLTPEELLGPLNDVEKKYAPLKLYVSGPMEISVPRPRLAIIGSRKASGKSLDVAGEIADRKSTRLNSSHSQISYAVFCLKKTTADRRWLHGQAAGPGPGPAGGDAGERGIAQHADPGRFDDGDAGLPGARTGIRCARRRWP